MKKTKVYRTIGWILVFYGAIGYFTSLLAPHKFQKVYYDPSKELMPALYGSLMLLATNIFLWLGIILHWRADRNDGPNKKSKWGKIIKPYLIFTIIMLLWTAYLVVIPNILRK